LRYKAAIEADAERIPHDVLERIAAHRRTEAWGGRGLARMSGYFHGKVE
jgi:hypothetical protein